MIDLSDEIRKSYEESTTQYDKIKIGNKEYPISNARTLDFEIENIVDLENKEFEYFTGIKVENSVHWISLGKFITIDEEPRRYYFNK